MARKRGKRQRFCLSGRPGFDGRSCQTDQLEGGEVEEAEEGRALFAGLTMRGGVRASQGLSGLGCGRGGG